VVSNKFEATKAGVPQGGIISPIICNMVLDKLGTIVKKALNAGNLLV